MHINKFLAWLIIVLVAMWAYGEVKVRLDNAKYWREIKQWEVDSIWYDDGTVKEYDEWFRLTN